MKTQRCESLASCFSDRGSLQCPCLHYCRTHVRFKRAPRGASQRKRSSIASLLCTLSPPSDRRSLLCRVPLAAQRSSIASLLRPLSPSACHPAEQDPLRQRRPATSVGGSARIWPASRRNALPKLGVVCQTCHEVEGRFQKWLCIIVELFLSPFNLGWYRVSVKRFGSRA